MLQVHEADLIKSVVSKDDYPDCDSNEIVILGRSNVGKSTFINKFTNRKRLAYTSSKPGKTQVLNFFKINSDLTLVDVPGYGYAKVSKVQREKFGVMIEEYLTTRSCLKFAILLVDFKVGPTEDDILMFDFLKFYNIPVFVIATKKDKVKKSHHSKHKKNITSKINLTSDDNLFIYSSEEKNDIINVSMQIEKKLYGDNNE